MAVFLRPAAGIRKARLRQDAAAEKMSAAEAVAAFCERGWPAFSVHIAWVPEGRTSSKGKPGPTKEIRPPAAWKEAAGKTNPAWTGVGINTGDAGLVVIDFDGEKGLKMEQRLRDHIGLTPTLTAMTAGGGKHWYFRADPDRPVGNATHLPLFDMVDHNSCVDVRGIGGFIIAPPSSYRDDRGNTKEYRWLDPEAEPVAIPKQLLEIIAAKSAAKSAGKRAVGKASAGAPPQEIVVRHRHDPEFVAQILAAIRDSRADDHQTWIKVGLALKRGGYELGLWDAFSQRSPKYSPAEVKDTWDAFDVSPRDSAIGIGSLVEMAKEDDPSGARLALDAMKRRAVDRGADHKRVLEMLSARLPQHFPPCLTDATLAADGKSLTITAGENKAVVNDHFDVAVEGVFVGNLLSDVELDIGPLSFFHRNIPSEATRFRFERSDKDTAILTSVVTGADAGLTLFDTGNGMPVVDVRVPGKTNSVVSSQKKIKDLAGLMLQAIKTKASQQLAPIHDAMYGALINNVNGIQNNIIVNPRAQEDDAGACELFIGWLKNEGYRPVTCDGRLIMYDPEDGIYHDRTDHKGLRKLLRKASIGEYSTSSGKQDALFKQLDDLADEDPGFFERADKDARRKLAFENGVWDFERGRLVPLSPDIVLFNKLPHRFPTGPDDLRRTKEIAAEIARRVVDPIWTRSALYVMQTTARAVAGEVDDRTYHFGIGETASGKGVWMDIVASALTTRHVGIINSGNIVWQRRAGDQAKNNSWLCAVRNNLINFTSEIQVGPGVFIDGNKIKELSNGGERHTGRQNNKDEYSFRLRGMPWSFANDIPPIKPTDSAVKSRVRFVPMEHTFLLGEEYQARKHIPGVLPGDEDIKRWVLSPEVGAAFAWMLTQAYVAAKVDPPPHVGVS